MFKKDQDSEFIEEILSNGHIKRYIKGRTLGKGGFAECYEFVSEETGKRYAAKVIDKQTLGKGKARDKLESQIIIHKSLRHQNIVKFQHFFQDHDYVYLLLELCCNNTLNQLLKRRKILTEVEVKYYTLQLLHALKYIHQHKIIHRDLKLGNFFLDEHLQLKVGDFGLANTLTSPHEKRKTVCGTPNYIAPEIIDSRKGHSYEVDIWSTGVIVYALLFGKPPFETNEVQLTYEKIKTCDYVFPKANVSDSAKDFIEKMLVLNPADRATIKQLLEHDFLTTGDIPKYLPLSALACPPSRTFLEQAKNDHHFLVQKKHEGDGHIQSSRTSKSSLAKQKCTIAIDKFESSRKVSKQGKTQRSQGSMMRVTSAATMPTTNKKAPVQKIEDLLVYVTYFEEQPKYGVFYILNTTSLGMRFNDQTCLASNQKLTQFKYVAMHNHIQSSTEIFDHNKQPEYLAKKIKIIRHFDRLLNNKATNTPANPLHKIKQDRSGSKIYLIAFFIVNNFYLFWLSNESFQANFKDKIDIVVDRNEVVHLITQSKRCSFKLSELPLQEEEVKQRVQAVCGAIKKVKRNRQDLVENKKQKENGTMRTSTSQAKMIKKVESRPIIAKNFSSTTNLHGSLKRPLSEYCSNKRAESSQKHY